MTLREFLLLAAALQLGIAVLNLFLVPLLKWQTEIARMPLLVREVFHVHAWFISLTLAIFATLTFRFSSEMALGHNPIAGWLAGAVGIFWAIRTVLQVVWYSSSHWRGQLDRTLIHIALLIVYGGFAVVYLVAARRLL
jgi:hypothetical protein